MTILIVLDEFFNYFKLILKSSPRVPITVLQKVIKKWTPRIEEDSILMTTLILDFFEINSAIIRQQNLIKKNRKTQKKFNLFLLNYYYFLINAHDYFKYPSVLAWTHSPEIDFFCLLSTKYHKTKYTVTTFEFQTVITASIGMILKYFGNYKKFFKRSYRANMLLARFIQNSITRYIRKRRYLFIVEGFNAKLFSLINLFNEVSKTHPMHYYIVRPKLVFGEIRFKRVKSIKRKIQKKNTEIVAGWLVKLKRYHSANYKI